MLVSCRSMGRPGLLLLLALSRATRGDEVIWQIGTFDDTYVELGKTRDHREYSKFYRGGVVFVVGKSDARNDWPFIHPGPRDRFAGRKAHSYAIEFRLAEEPAGTYLLRLDFVDVHYRLPPRLKIRVNDTEGVFSLRPGVGDV